MIARKIVTALFIALLISGAFTYWVSRRMNRTHDHPVAARQRFVVAAHEIRSGELLRPETLAAIESPSPTTIPGSFARIEDVAGRATLYPLTPGEPILERYLAAAGSGSGLAVKIPAGMRAISLKSDEVMGVSGFLLPGTYVDILVTYHTSKDPELVTSTVLQDIQVIAAGQQTQPDPDGKPSIVSVVTILLKPSDAVKAVMASSQGPLHFVLRNGTDREQVQQRPISASELGQPGQSPTNASLGTTALKANAKPKAQQIETYLGDKHVVTSFN